MRRVLYFFLYLILLLSLKHSTATVIDTITLEKLEKGFSLEKKWLFVVDDKPEYATKAFNDSDWTLFAKGSKEEYLDSIYKKAPVILWFRYKFIADASIDKKITSLEFTVKDACEIYLDGIKIKTIGTLEINGEKGVSGFSAKPEPMPIVLDSGEHVIAVRYSRFSGAGDNRDLQIDVLNTGTGFSASMETIENSIDNLLDTTQVFIFSFFSGIFLTLSLFHFILFLFYRKNRSNLYYSLLTLLLFIIFFGIYKIISGSDFYLTTKIGILEIVSILSIPLFFISLLYQIFYKRMLLYFWILSTLLATGLVMVAYSEDQSTGSLFILIFVILSFIEILRIYIQAWRKKKEGAGIFLFGILLPPLGTIVLALIAYVLKAMNFTEISTTINSALGEFIGYGMLLSVSVSMTIYLAKDFSKMNLKLSQQLEEIKKLFQKTIAQENERKRILENQNVELEKNVKERTKELAQKNRDILDNLQYAQRIQTAILPETGMIYQTLKDSFIFYRPKDIVSGDFYTFSQKNGKVIIAAADCTGHGVTGAFLSMIGISLLNQLVNESGITEPAQILNQLNAGIVSSLKQKASEVSDGMDIAICSFDLKENTLEYSGANRPLYLIRNGSIEEIKPDKLAIGGFRLNTEATFKNHFLKLTSGDSIYIFTDGYVDQFGGEKSKKMLSKRLREHLLSIQHLTMSEQENSFIKYFDTWKGTNEQVDDVLLIGIRI